MSQAIDLCGEALHLLPEKALWWPARRSLLLADWHLGKAMHFRRHGLPVPLAAEQDNFARLAGLLARYPVEQVLLLGDLFHSAYNSAWEDFIAFRQAQPAADWHLVMGNHDALSANAYARAGLRCHADTLALGPFLLSHQPREAAGGAYVLAGHIHPAVWLRGPGGQRERYPCFFFGPQQGLLPAFGRFTGHGICQAKAGDRVFVIGGQQVLEV